MSPALSSDDDNFDAAVDQQIDACLRVEAPTSFFVLAGAGSGKTRSLVQAIDRCRTKYGEHLRLRGQKLGVVTYTRAATEEIKERLKFDPLVMVSTIHSFAWSLIGGYNTDIKAWLKVKLLSDIEQLRQALEKGKPGTKIEVERRTAIERNERRLVSLDSIKSFTYSPTGDNRGRDALSHSEVIEITAAFLRDKDALRRILINLYPFLMIDECQDTNQELLEALLHVQALHPNEFGLGLFGDQMQRIYMDGKADLPSGLPDTWKKPAKRMNHRSPERVVQLINRIRDATDKQVQRNRTNKPGGKTRLFVLPRTTQDKFQAEANIANRMIEITGDKEWDPIKRNFKTLTLEHHMAARRMGFADFFSALYGADRFKTGMLDGSLSGVSFLLQDFLPLIEAVQREDDYAATAILRTKCPLLESRALKKAGVDQLKVLQAVNDSVKALGELLKNADGPTILDLLAAVQAGRLLSVPDVLVPFVASHAISDQGGDRDEESDAWSRALAAPWRQLVAYSTYITGKAPFATHQGVKGLEFPRVMVVIDDEEARGFLFSYDKLLGGKEETKADRENRAAGKDNSIERTRRLFYVTCSRARESLAIVHYTDNPTAVADNAIQQGLFAADEVEVTV
jgi:DNA helicase-2/ATP-dependent DNA helicase PcrA